MNNIISNIRNLEKEKIIEILQYKDVNHLKLLNIARDIRNNGKFKNKAELRSVIEISNICSQKCKYCSIGNKKEKKFVQSKEEIIQKINLLIKLSLNKLIFYSSLITYLTLCIIYII